MSAIRSLRNGCTDFAATMVVIVVGLVASLSATAQSRTPQNTLASPPVLYTSELPCADCQGFRYELDLRPRDIFFLRTTYVGNPSAATQYEFGKWSLAENHLVLMFLSDAHKQESFSVKENATVRKLDSDGKEIQSRANYDLIRQSYVPIEPTLHLSGMYQHRTDAAVFQECLTGIAIPVAEEGDNANLQRAYAVARKEPGLMVYVELEGRVALRPGAKSRDKINTLVVDKAGKFFPLKACESNLVIHEFESTRWVPVSLSSQPITLQPQQRESFIVFDAKEHRVAGFGGCNRITGSYALVANTVKISQLAATMMACTSGMDTEAPLMKALEATATWRIVGDRLELLDAAGSVSAILAARDL